MSMTIFILLFSVGFLALLGVLLQQKKIRDVVFATLVALLVVFDFALLSLDKIYLLHQEQDSQYEQTLLDYDSQIAQQVATYQQLTQIQLDMTLQMLAQSNPLENEASIQQKLKWRDDIQQQLTGINFDATAIEQVKIKIDQLAHQYLMENLNQQLRQSIGHRNYSEFVRSRPRSQWTDELFVKEVEAFLNKGKLMEPDIKFALTRVREFDQSGVLMQRPQ
ncbi:hypothetical protein A9Q73_10675 [Bermanella sp. 47_1433_sub80_T6]|nr:hypothetical protein A9Q73_10675 [Bermanella sp. 47_1433_sub80_T6]